MNNSFNIAIGCDHAGFEQKEILKHHLAESGYVVVDFGTYSSDSVDYPDFAHKVAENVLKDDNTVGILLCGSGNGVCLTANKHKGIRAALCWLPELGVLARQHNNANILCLPSRYISNETAIEISIGFLNSTFEEGRHQKRVEKIDL